MSHPKLIALNFQARIDEAANRETAHQDFRQRFPALPQTDLAPQVTWAEIERQLAFLSGGTTRATWEVSALRKETAGQPAEMFLQRLMTLAWAIIDDSPDSTSMEGPGMT